MRLSVVGVFTFVALVCAAPEIKLGETTLVGRDITLLKLDFFGGMSYKPFSQFFAHLLFRYSIR